MNLSAWIQAHPARAASLAGWYQQAAGIFASLFVVPGILAALNDRESGIWFSFQMLMQAVALADFGFSFAIARQVAHSLALRTDQPARDATDFIATRPGWPGVAQVHRAGRIIFRRVGATGLLLLVVVHEGILRFTKLAEAQTADSAIAWYVLGIALLLAMQSRLNQSVLEGLGAMYLTKAVSGTVQILNGVGIVATLTVCPRLPAIAGVLLGTAVIQYLAFRWLVGRHARGRLTDEPGPTDREMLRRFWRVSVPVGVVNSSSYCVSSIQVPLAGALLGAAAVTPFYLAQRIGQVVIQGIMQVMFPHLPLFTHDCAAGNLPAARRRMEKTTVLVWGAALLGFAVYYAASPLFVRWWIGPGKYVSNHVLLVMSADFTLMACAVVLGHFVLAGGRNPFVWSTLANGALNVLLACWLCPSLGLLGLPLAGVLSGLATSYWFNPLHGFRLWRGLKQQPR